MGASTPNHLQRGPRFVSAAARRMAEAMREITAERGACTETDLWQAGFTPDEISRIGPIAAAEAATTSKAKAWTYG